MIAEAELEQPEYAATQPAEGQTETANTTEGSHPELADSVCDSTEPEQLLRRAATNKVPLCERRQ
jgi:hypothetical protein